MNKIELYLGDCLEKMKLLEDKSVDMILCDLPYGTTACIWDIRIPFEPLWKECNRIIKKNGAVVLFGSESFSSYLRISNMKNYKYDWVWEKQKAANFMGTEYSPLKYHDNILVFSNETVKFNAQKYKVLEIEEIEQNYKTKGAKYLIDLIQNKTIDRYGKIDKRKNVNNPITNKEHIGININRIRNTDNGLRNPKSIIKINKSINGNVHPTEKPVALLEYLIKTYTNENEIVLDNCFGSCSTGIACINTKRNFIGMELDSNYFEIGKNRVLENKNLVDDFDLIVYE